MIPERFSPTTFALFRIVFGLLWICHGLQKFGMLGPPPPALDSLHRTAGVIEITAGALVMVGLVTKLAAFIASGEMAVAFFTQHLPMGLWPLLNGGEPAVLYCFAFLYIASKGAGLWSLDALRGGQRNVREARQAIA